MKKVVNMANVARPAPTPQSRGAGAPIARRGRSALFLATAGLLGLSGLAGCAANVPPSSSGQGVVALFNPAASPAVVPSPTDLVRVGGMLQVPVDPAEATNGALQTFNNYLRGLDGFPPDSTATTAFSAAIDVTSLPEGVVIYDATTSTLLTSAQAVPATDPNSGNTQLVINNTNRWTHGHTYFVGLLSWMEGTDVHGLRGADTKLVLADSAFAFLRSSTPIFAKCQDATNPDCACTDLTDSACHSVVDGLVDAQAQQLEVGRLGIKPIIDAVLALNGRMRSDLVMAFSFTISTRSFATFDTARGQVPFPSNLLLKMQGMAGPTADDTVNLPILPTDSAQTQALKGGLNTLDGFSTTGSVQFPIDSAMNGAVPVDIVAASVIPNRTAFLINAIPGGKQPSYKAQPLEALLGPANNVSGFAGQIWVTPTSPLISDRNTYAAVLTTNIKDAMGQSLVPAPVTLLITQSSPLMLNGKSAISTIPLAQAEQLEPLRMALAPLVAELAAQGIDPSTIAAITAYRTQSVIKPLLTLIGANTALAPVIPSTVNVTSNLAATTPLSAILYGTLSVRRVVDLRGPFNTGRLTADTTNNDVIPFLMTLPDPALVSPAGSAVPVVIVQHGLGRWRGDALAIAQTLAAKGMATIAIDVIYHGGRTICLSSADCAAGVSCNQPAAVNGQPQPGACVGGAYLASVAPADVASALPGINLVAPDSKLPSRDFTNLANPFAQRDNFRQHVLDLLQLVRVIKDGSASGLSMYVSTQTGLPHIDSTKIGYLGQSLGSILGTSFLAMTSNVSLGVLNVGGGDLVDMFTDPNSGLSFGIDTELGVTQGTPAFYALLENFRWIMDPAEPLNLARFVRTPDTTVIPGRTTGAKVILQEAGMDKTILNPYTLALGKELGLPVDNMSHLQGINGEGGASPNNVSTYFATASHGAIFTVTDPGFTPMQTQAVTYLATGLSGTAPKVQ